MRAMPYASLTAILVLPALPLFTIPNAAPLLLSNVPLLGIGPSRPSPNMSALAVPALKSVATCPTPSSVA
jgi:hypothetical protein